MNLCSECKKNGIDCGMKHIKECNVCHERTNETCGTDNCKLGMCMTCKNKAEICKQGHKQRELYIPKWEYNQDWKTHQMRRKRRNNQYYEGSRTSIIEYIQKRQKQKKAYTEKMKAWYKWNVTQKPQEQRYLNKEMGKNTEKKLNNVQTNKAMRSNAYNIQLSEVKLNTIITVHCEIAMKHNSEKKAITERTVLEWIRQNRPNTNMIILAARKISESDILI